LLDCDRVDSRESALAGIRARPECEALQNPIRPCGLHGNPVRHPTHPARRAAPPDKETRMIPFFVQIKCQLGRSYEVASALADAEIASEIFSTAGEFDLLVKFYVEPGTDIGHFVTEKVQRIPGVQDTRTIITFKAF
jgi:DNA-binding Lrp family transcriptional regulator